MKKGICFLGMLIAFMLYTTPVHAGAIWEPDIRFYKNHSVDCKSLNREYIVNGPKGKAVILYESPKSDKKVTTLKNGWSISVSYIYEDEQGIMWGYTSYEEKAGWAPMDYMELCTDGDSRTEIRDDEKIQNNDMIKPQTEQRILPVVIMVSAAVLVTAALLILLRERE